MVFRARFTGTESPVESRTPITPESPLNSPFTVRGLGRRPDGALGHRPGNLTDQHFCSRGDSTLPGQRVCVPWEHLPDTGGGYGG